MLNSETTKIKTNVSTNLTQIIYQPDQKMKVKELDIHLKTRSKDCLHPIILVHNNKEDNKKNKNYINWLSQKIMDKKSLHLISS